MKTYLCRGPAAWLAGAVLVMSPFRVALTAAAPSSDLTLEAAITEGFERSPELRLARADLAAARGRAMAARRIPANPELEIRRGSRTSGPTDSTDRGIELAQEFEIAGQRAKRIAAAEEEIAAAEASLVHRSRLVSSLVERAFVEALRAREFSRLAETDSALTDRFLDVTRRRFDAGAASQIDVNLAAATAGRARRAVARERAAELAARSLLAEAVGRSASDLPVPAGELALPHQPRKVTLEDLVAAARGRRADLEAFRAAERAANERVALARRERVPDITVRAFSEEEEGTDEIRGVALAWSLPLFNRRRGELLEAEAERERAGAESALAERAAEREVVVAHAAREAATVAASELDESVVGRLDENLNLLERSYTAGKIGATDLLLLRRELVEARRDWIEVVAAGWSAAVVLDLALGNDRWPSGTVENEEHDGGEK